MSASNPRGRKPRGRKPKYIHLLRAMRAGDVLYLAEDRMTGRLDMAIASSVRRARGKIETTCFVAVNVEPTNAHRVVRVTCLKPLRK